MISSSPLPERAPSTDLPPALMGQMGVAMAGRTLLNTARRFPYPFATALSRGLGVPLPAITSLIAVNQITGLLALFAGPLADQWGYRLMLISGLSLLATGMLAAGLLPFYGVVLVALFMAGLGKSVFDPALQAYVGRRVPYQRRGLVIGIIEMSWAASSLIGIPLMGLLIDRAGWRSPFWVLGALALAGVVALAKLIPAAPAETPLHGSAFNLKTTWRQLKNSRVALGGLGFSFCVAAANDNLFVVYGAWLESRFALSVVALGLATTVIGVAELCGESLTAGLSDRLGLKPSLFAGLILSSLSYALLPYLGQTLPLALLALFVLFVGVEYTIVTSVSLFTEVLPEARATMMSGWLAAASLGRVSGALLGGVLWPWGGIIPISLVSTFISGLALLWLSWGLRHWHR